MTWYLCVYVNACVCVCVCVCVYVCVCVCVYVCVIECKTTAILHLQPQLASTRSPEMCMNNIRNRKCAGFPTGNYIHHILCMLLYSVLCSLPPFSFTLYLHSFGLPFTSPMLLSFTSSSKSSASRCTSGGSCRCSLLAACGCCCGS